MSENTDGGFAAAKRRRYKLRLFGARLSMRRGLKTFGRRFGKGAAGSSSEILDTRCNCNCKWLCPTCGYAVSRTQMRKVQRVLRSWTADGGAVAFLTLTQSHCPSDDLATLWDRIEAGWKALTRGAVWTMDKQIYGIRGYFRCTEIVYSPTTGWNVHFHVILLLNVELDAVQLNRLQLCVGRRFAAGVVRKGGSASVHAQDLRPMTPGTEERLAAYCLNGTTMHTSPNGSRSPMAILSHLESTGQGLALWEEFTRAVSQKKRVQFVASAGIEELCIGRPQSCLIARSLIARSSN
ncbi:protein rep [Mycobacterium lentiflavum]|jgi:hypothetical protein|uniref:protein rep n=1 Tax=Mycobacterium lentiflavum TaxID=141349 RepID=UPI003313DA9E